MQNILYENEFDLHVNEAVGGTHYEKFRTETHFDTKAKGNSQMAYFTM